MSESQEQTIKSSVEELCKNVMISCLLCPFDSCGAGMSNYAIRASVINNSTWLIQLKCPKCHKNWHTCRKCRNRKKCVFVNQQQISSHQYHFHRDDMVSSEKNIKQGRRSIFR